PRIRRALLDMIMVSGPGLATFVGWAAISWLITGEGFAQFTSHYGNTAILAQSGQVKSGLGGGLTFAAVCTFVLAPAVVPSAAFAVARRWRRNWQVLTVPLVIYG